ncbi:segregation and condensation protein B [Litchfieldella qijiaojingensis]|uniref:Segregation and condensation protein B n=1 Tax=Litchfieldella qijiaojingensis TaxID=980347 RepID=A0ABQ2YNF9_9GAMM|nr:SMC-Scp complex subunit ScpB [Halomonas qijiaojingensis]GGX90142.1 segregation and condensation protein B [Halomonas qijiaojingensis]
MNDAFRSFDSPALDEILEGVLLAAGEPVSLERIEALFDDMRPPSRAAIRESLAKLSERLENTALELCESASGYQVRIRQRLSPWVSRLWDERPQRYSRALLETLALIAYRQPVTRGDIEEVRGVAVSSSIMRTLSDRGWIRVVGQRDVPGRPAVYATTRQFLDDFGLKTLDALPPMHELKDFDEWQANLEAAGVDDGPRGNATEQGGDVEEREDDAASAATPHDEYGDELDQDNELATTGMADAEPHAEKASSRPGLSFSDLEARLAERARETVEEDGHAGAATPTDEKSDDS